jgi:hypothetical protein
VRDHPSAAVLQTALNTLQYAEGFLIKHATDTGSAARFLVEISQQLRARVADSVLYPLATYAEFALVCSKTRASTVGEMWGRMLRCVPGVSAARAAAILQAYPTCTALMDAYERCLAGERAGMLATLPLEGLRTKVGVACSAAVYKTLCGDGHVR